MEFVGQRPIPSNKRVARGNMFRDLTIDLRANIRPRCSRSGRIRFAVFGTILNVCAPLRYGWIVVHASLRSR